QTVFASRLVAGDQRRAVLDGGVGTCKMRNTRLLSHSERLKIESLGWAQAWTAPGMRSKSASGRRPQSRRLALPASLDFLRAHHLAEKRVDVAQGRIVVALAVGGGAIARENDVIVTQKGLP